MIPQYDNDGRFVGFLMWPSTDKHSAGREIDWPEDNVVLDEEVRDG